MSEKTHSSADADALITQIEALNAEKQQLISLVSHDLRSPLNRAFALSELLLMDADTLNSFQKDYLEKMRLVIADGLAMMRNLVDYRNLEFKSIDIRPERVNLPEFVDKIVHEFKPTATKKQLRIQVEHRNSNVTTITDKQCLDRVLNNLVSNACKFSKPEKLISIRSGLTSNNKFQIDIQDEIGGFDESEYRTLFSKFQKYAAEPTGNESSTGLGLFIAKSMANRIDATLECKTVEGVGSTFIVTLPVSS